MSAAISHVCTPMNPTGGTTTSPFTLGVCSCGWTGPWHSARDHMAPQVEDVRLLDELKRTRKKCERLRQTNKEMHAALFDDRRSKESLLEQVALYRKALSKIGYGLEADNDAVEIARNTLADGEFI